MHETQSSSFSSTYLRQLSYLKFQCLTKLFLHINCLLVILTYFYLVGCVMINFCRMNISAKATIVTIAGSSFIIMGDVRFDISCETSAGRQ